MDDGGEVDLDLGNYERFLNVTLHKDNNITTGNSNFVFILWLIILGFITTERCKACVTALA